MEGMRRFIILNFSDWRVSLKKGRLKSDDPFVGSIAKYISSTAGSSRLVSYGVQKAASLADARGRRTWNTCASAFILPCIYPWSSSRLDLTFPPLPSLTALSLNM